MIADLGLRFKFLGGEVCPFSPNARLLFLNKAQLHVASELSLYYVRELQELTTSQALGSNGELDLTSLDPALLEGEKGVISVKLTGGKYCTFLTGEKRRANEDASVTYYTSAPVYYFEAGNLYVHPFAAQTIDLCYKKIPTDMAFGQLQFYYDADNTPSTTKFVGKADQGLSAVNSYYNGAVIKSLEHNSYHVVTAYVGATRLFTVSPAASTNFTDSHEFRIGKESAALFGLSHADVDCALGARVQDIIVERAAGLAFEYDDKESKAAICYSKADIAIRTLNSKYRPVTPLSLEVGTLVNRRGW